MANADFTPTKGAYTELKPFRFWCQKVLPLVYDDSLSYYELLCKVVDYLNKTMEDVDTLNSDVTNLFTAYDQLQDWVNAYYESADFEAAIDAGLDRMAEDGRLDALMRPLIDSNLPELVYNMLPDTVSTLLPDEVANQIGPAVQTQLPGVVSNQIGPTVQTQLPGVVSNQIGGTVQTQLPGVVSNQIGPVVEEKIVDPVEDWLETYVSGGNAIDRTLSILGAGADAAFTGARLDTLDNVVGYDHVADTGSFITTATPFVFNYEVINDTGEFSDQGTHTYKMLVIPVNTGDKYCINAHKISIAGITENHFAVTYAFCAKHIGDPDTDTPYYLPTTYGTNNAENLIVTAPEINIPTGQYYDETTGYLVVITTDIQDPVYKVTDSVARESEITELKDDFNQIANEETTLFTLSDWRNGYLRDSAPIGSVGSSPENIVSGYNGAYVTTKGDDHTYNITLDSGWVLRRLGKYATNTLGSFVEFVDTSSGKVTLSKNYYYIFELRKEPIANISASDVTATTIVLSETKYYPLLSEKVHSYNWCNPTDITANSGKYLGVNGEVGVGGQYSYTGFIPVNEGDKVYILRDGMIRTNARFRYVTAYDAEKAVLSNLGEATAGRIYTVPTGVAFVRITVFLDDYNLGYYAININKIMPYDEYREQTLPTGVGANKTDILLLNDMPLSTMPEYIVKALAYRPLSTPKKGYMCLVTDDGKEGMVSYTIPMIISKNVPCTFAVMSESECFSTSERTQVVVDAVNNHGCAISQHGGRNWTEYSEYGLNKYFEEETAFFSTIGLTAKSAVIPSHYTTPLVETVAGGRYGVVRSGYKGYNADGVYGGTVHNYYDYYTSGEGSNLFGLSSYNFSGRSLADNQTAIDYAYANNKIMIVYWHENALTDATKAVIEQSIDYAKTKGLEFITLDQIPFLNEWPATF